MPDFPSSSPATILVYENAPFWTPELQRQFLNQNVTIRSRHRSRDVKPFLRDNSTELVIVCFENQKADAVGLLGELGRERLVSCLMILPREDLSLEWVLRELGAEAVFPEPLQGEHLANHIRRRLAISTT